MIWRAISVGPWGVAAWLTWRALVLGLASLADPDWPINASDSPDDHYGSGFWCQLARPHTPPPSQP